ncbi:Holliday junction resolvase RuvX [Candidatus Uhrbacteria bacterium]|nr:Holliday junction resolvase RuvX [Candidatus Uhrbacteria bacterium]
MRLLGIDYGSKRVGTAISDETGTLAFPHAVLLNNKELLPALQKIIAEEKVTEIVMGESHDYKGKENPIMEGIRACRKTLEQETKLPVHLEPEFLTSAQAAYFQGKHDKLDASAAAIILQSYLDKLNRLIA